MDYRSGNIFIRKRPRRMRVGEIIQGHCHNFDHTTFVFSGVLRIRLITGTDYVGTAPEDAPFDFERVIDARTDDEPWQLILKGRFHSLEALSDDVHYGCVYSHQMPQEGVYPGNPTDGGKPYSMVDSDGDTWMRVDPNVVQDSMKWVEAYR